MTKITTTHGIASLSPYQAGRDINAVKREFALENIVKLASNENPLGPSQKAIKAAQATLADMHIYPDPNAYELRQALIQHLGIDDNQLTLGHGSDSLLSAIAQLFSAPGGNIVVSQYAFATFSIVAKAHNLEVKTTPADGWQQDLTAMLAAVDENTRAIFIANPNNPTGSYLNSQQIEDFLRELPEHVILVLDQAYYEYARHLDDYPEGLSWLSDFPNLIITRTFSKAYALAGLRIGYCISNPTIQDWLNRIRLPFNLTVPSQAAAVAALADQAHIEESLAINRQGQQQLQQFFQDRSIDYIDSIGNFITIDVKQAAADINLALLKQGVIVRPLAPYGMNHHLRISIGLDWQNKIFIDSLSNILGA